MAMLITKFNKMIRSKVLWGGFAVIICVSFVGTGLSLRGTGCDKTYPDAVGLLFGEPVSSREFARARFFELGMRYDTTGMSEEERADLRKRIWKRIAVLRTAKSMDITVPDSEMRELIQGTPAFASASGGFDREIYRNTIESSRGVRVETFEEYLRQQLTLTKVANAVSAMAWTPPQQVENQMSDLTDTFTIQYVAITTNDLDAVPEVTREQAREFFDNNSETFEVPEQRRVRYVSFPISNYVGGTEIAIEDIQDYYYDNTNNFAMETTNGTRVLKPLTNVQDEIRAVLLRHQAVAGARSAATTFEMAMASGRGSVALSMEQAAKVHNLVIRTSELFSAYSPVPGLDVDYEFNTAAFRLTDEPEQYFSGAITGESNVYIIATETNIPAHIPEFNDVVDDVIPVAERDALEKALTEKAEGIRATIDKGLQEDKAFSNLVAELDVEMHSPEPFSLYQVRSGLGLEALSNDVENVAALVPALSKLYDGDLTEVEQGFGRRVIALVVARVPSAPFLRQMLKPRVTDTLNNMVASAVFSDWQDDLLKRAELDDFALSRREKAEKKSRP